jgi:predicted SprT family Zn-dependent metalloprotease
MPDDKAERFALNVLADGEQFRRRMRNKKGLPGEVHLVHTRRRIDGVAEFKCLHCNRVTTTRVNNRERDEVFVECVHCGDKMHITSVPDV